MAKSDGQITDINLKLDSDDDIMNRSLDSQGSKSKRGRPLIPFAWTRVIPVENIDMSAIKIFSIATDLLSENFMPVAP